MPAGFQVTESAPKPRGGLCFTGEKSLLIFILLISHSLKAFRLLDFFISWVRLLVFPSGPYSTLPALHRSSPKWPHSSLFSDQALHLGQARPLTAHRIVPFVQTHHVCHIVPSCEFPGAFCPARGWAVSARQGRGSSLRYPRATQTSAQRSAAWSGARPEHPGSSRGTSIHSHWPHRGNRAFIWSNAN